MPRSSLPAAVIGVSIAGTNIQFEKLSPVTAYGVLVVGLGIATAAMFWLGRLADRFGRKRFAVAMAAGLAVWSLPAFLLLGMGTVTATIGLALFATFQFGTMISSGLAVVELFPVDVRATAAGVPYAIAFALFGGTAPLVAISLAAGIAPFAPAFYVIILALIGLPVAWFGLPEAREMAVQSQDGASLTSSSMRAPGLVESTE